MEQTQRYRVSWNDEYLFHVYHVSFEAATIAAETNLRNTNRGFKVRGMSIELDPNP